MLILYFSHLRHQRVEIRDVAKKLKTIKKQTTKQVRKRNCNLKANWQKYNELAYVSLGPPGCDRSNTWRGLSSQANFLSTSSGLWSDMLLVAAVGGRTKKLLGVCRDVQLIEWLARCSASGRMATCQHRSNWDSNGGCLFFSGEFLRRTSARFGRMF